MYSTGFDLNGFGIELYNKVTNSWKHHHNTTASLLSVDKFRSFWVVIADGKIEYDKKKANTANDTLSILTIV